MADFGKSFGGGRRNTGRSAMVEQAIVSTLSTCNPATVVDISRTGAKLRGVKDARAGDELLLRIEKLLLYGKIRWVRGTLCGVQFDGSLSRYEFEQLRHKNETACLSRGGGEQRLAFDDWLTGMAR